MKIRPRKERPLVLVVSDEETRHWLCANEAAHKMFLAHRDKIDFAFRDSVSDICIEEDLYLIIFSTDESSCQTKEFIQDNSSNKKIRIIYNTKQLHGKNFALALELIKTRFKQLQQEFPQLA